MYKKGKTQRGITLIALVITIIVMLILVGVTISMAVNGGLFDQAEKATGQTKNALNAEQELSNGGVIVDGNVYNSITEYLNKDKEPISKETSYVGKYADVDGDGDVDGIIYADLAKGKENGSWGDYNNDYGTYTIPKETGLKDYYVSKTGYVGTFGTEPRDVITAIGESGKDRFYVMALSDVSESAITWYKSKASSGLSVNPNPTSESFGTGKANTVKMIELWNKDTDISKDSNDVWGVIQNSNKYEVVKTVNDSRKWFIPSREEVAAYYGELGIIDENYESYDAGYVCSSSLGDDGKFVYSAAFGFGYGIIDWELFSSFTEAATDFTFRLSTTF